MKMKNYVTKLVLSATLSILFAGIMHAQTITLKFTALHTCAHIPLDSVKIKNTTNSTDTLLVYPDTTLSIVLTSINAYFQQTENNFEVSNNFPNPFSNRTSFNLNIKKDEEVSISIYDINGKKVIHNSYNLEKGKHEFSFSGGSSVAYFAQIETSDSKQGLKMFQISTENEGKSRLVYEGMSNSAFETRQTLSNFVYNIGEQLEFIGYVTKNSISQSQTLTGSPSSSQNYIFSIAATNLPAQPSAIIGNQTLCQGNNGISYQVTNVSGITYNWAYSGSGATIASGQGSNSITVNYASNATSGNLSVTPSNACGNGPAASIPITVNALPAQPGSISGLNSQTPNATNQIYNINTVPGATSYNWTVPNGWSISSGQGTTQIGVTVGGVGSNGLITVKAINSCGESNSSTLSVTVSDPSVFNCGQDFTDTRDGQVYGTVVINDRCWMKKNMNYSGHTHGESFCYGNNPNNCNIFGRLYTFRAATDGQGHSSLSPSGLQGICPDGWHLPSDLEWYQMENFVDNTINSPTATGWRGLNGGTKLKTNLYWEEGIGTNNYGFTALPGGRRSNIGDFSGLGMQAWFWTSSIHVDIINAWPRILYANEPGIWRRPNTHYDNAMSVRCVRLNW